MALAGRSKPTAAAGIASQRDLQPVAAAPVPTNPSKITYQYTFSPPSSPRPLDTLLPGYASRPQPSPVKATRQQPTLETAELSITKGDVSTLGVQNGQNGGLGSFADGFQNKDAHSGGGVPTLLELAAQNSRLREDDNVAQQPLVHVHAHLTPPETAIVPSTNQDQAQVPLSDILSTPLPTIKVSLQPDIITRIPLPAAALQYEAQFRRIISVYDFFQRHHIQCTWQALEQSMRSTAPTFPVTLEDLKTFAALCPQVVHVAPHISASDDPQNRYDDWRQGNNTVRGGGGATASENGRFDGTGDLVVTLSDAWEARYGEDGAPPRSFLEEIQTTEERENNSKAQMAQEKKETTIAEDNSDSSPDRMIDKESSGSITASGKVLLSRKRRRVQSNKRYRMAWELRKSLVVAVAFIQELHFGGNAPKVPLLAAPRESVAANSLKRPRPTRRSKAGQRAQAATAASDAIGKPHEEIISLLDDLEETPTATEQGPLLPSSDVISKESCDLNEILAQGRWHPAFPINTAVTSETIAQAAQAMNASRDLEVRSGGDDRNGPTPVDADYTQIDALAAVRLQEQPTKPKPSARRAQKSRPAAPPQLLKKHAPCTDTSPLSATAFLQHLQALSGYKGQVVHVEHIPGRAAQNTALLPAPPAPILQALNHRGVAQLYSHQTKAITSLRAGQHTVVATSTASGKSLCYVVPILEALVANPASCAVLIFPTKALAQDQLRALRGMCTAAFGDAAPAVDIYDGDTPMSDRGAIQDRAQIILTNPDMLHLSILPVHSQFARVLSNLKYVVVDEAHTYKGVFGCHSALVLRRLRRVCSRVYGVEPVFAVTTATVANPKQHACTLLGVQDVVVVQEDGSPHGPKDFVLWNPPLMKSKEEGAAGGGGSSSAGKVSKRQVEEARRAALRAARQERNTGVMLGPKTEEKDWVAAVGAGQRDPVAKERFEAAISAENSPLKKQKADKQDSKQQEPQLTARQRALVAEAAAALSAASGPYTDPSTLPKIRDVDATGAAVGTRRLIKVGPDLGITAVDAMAVKKKGGKHENTAPGGGAPSAATPETEGGHNASAQTEFPSNLEHKSSKIRARLGSSGVDPSSARSSPIVEIAALLAETVQHGLRTIAFCKTRKLSELVTAYVREILAVTAPDLCTKVAVYRAGYSAAERREIEAALFSGALLGVAATNALELGVDIGGLDATLHLGFPGSIASLWQQAGRAGRREQPSIGIYVGWDGPLDQYFLTNPSNLFSRPIESAMVDVSNPAALQSHIACAAFEAQLHPHADANEYFGPGLVSAIAVLQSKSVLGRNLLYTGTATNPASTFALRAIDPNRFTIVDESVPGGGKVLEEVEESKAFYQVHDGSTYFFQGRTYLCRKLDLEARVALMRPVNVKYYTKPVDFTAVQVIGGGESIFPNGTNAVVQQNSTNSTVAAGITAQPLLSTSAMVSAATVTTRWLGFVRVWRGTGQVFDSVNLFLPDVQYQTEAAYIRLPPSARRAVEAAGLPFRDGVHAAGHAVLNALPLFIMANPQDVGTECDNPYDTRFKPERILIYDKHPGGIGLAAAARPRFTELMSRALAMLSTCPCEFEGGCPGCVQHTDCGEYNSVLNKEAGQLVLKCCLEAEAERYGFNKEQLGLRKEDGKEEAMPT